MSWGVLNGDSALTPLRPTERVANIKTNKAAFLHRRLKSGLGYKAEDLFVIRWGKGLKFYSQFVKWSSLIILRLLSLTDGSPDAIAFHFIGEVKTKLQSGPLRKAHLGAQEHSPGAYILNDALVDLGFLFVAIGGEK